MSRWRLHPRAANDGDGWVSCRCGHRHWGKYGASGLLLARDGEILLQHRAVWSHQGGTWAVPGGARASCEDVLTTALREAYEEARVPVEAVSPLAAYVEDHHSWSYTTVIGTADHRFEPVRGDAESVELAWVPVDLVSERPLHPAFAAAWPALRQLLDRRLVVVIDAANVVGSVPDGWWRDRAGATARLRDRLRKLGVEGLSATDLPGVAGAGPASRWWPQLLLVTEGQARSVQPVDGVAVVAAPRDGDTTIVEVVDRHRADRAGDHVYVVTADRALQDRVTQVGGRPISPGVLLDLLPW